MDPRYWVDLWTESFGWDLVQVRETTSMCEPALKAVNGSYVGSLALPSQQCFSLTNARDATQAAVLETTTFAEDAVTVRSSLAERGLMCEAALVGGGDGELEPVVRQCFALTEGADPGRWVELITDRFGYDEVLVRSSSMMCETALEDF
jgi:hypothetical protein